MDKVRSLLRRLPFKAAWTALALVLLILAMSMYASNKDIDLVLAYAMLALSFPMGWLGTPILAHFGNHISDPYIGMLAVWAVFFGCGYLQWFVVLPHSWKWLKLRSKRA